MADMATKSVQKDPVGMRAWLCRVGIRLAHWYPCRLVGRTVRLFLEARCPLWASGLTYYSIFAVVPVLALLFGVAKGFGLDEWLDRFLREELAAHQEVLKLILSFTEKALPQAHGGWIAGIGVAVLLYSVIAMIRHIEKAVGAVLGIKSGRGLIRIVTDYVSMLFIFPLLLLLAASATLLFNGAMRRMIDMNEWLALLGRPFWWCLQWITPWLLASLVFMALFIVLSNGKMRLLPALMGGVASGVLLRLLQGGYFFIQIHLTGYNAIYGSFAALPLFLIWMYLSWNIILVGVALGSAAQGMKTHEFEEDEPSGQSTFPNRKLLLLLTALITRDFSRGLPPPGEEGIAERCGLGLRRVRIALEILVEAGLINRVVGREDDSGYAPVFPPEQMTTCLVWEKLDNLNPLPAAGDGAGAADGELPRLELHLRELERRQADSDYNCRLSDL